MIAGIIFVCSVSGGCADQNLSQYLPDTDIHTEEPLSDEELQNTDGLQQNGVMDAEESAVEEASQSALQEEEIPDIYYAYHTLDEPKQKLYREIWNALKSMAQEVVVSTLDSEELNQIFHCVLADHPELFYVEGYQYTKYTIGDAVTKLTFQGTYSMTWEEMEQKKAQIETQANNWMAPVEQVTDEYAKVKYLYDYLIKVTEYDMNADENQNISSVFLQGRSVCQGYAKAMQYLLQKQGIQTVLITGYANGEGHAWNLVKVNGSYYYLDPTWGDASYNLTESDTSYTGEVPPINYDYFLVTTAEILKTHQIDRVMELPECVEIKDNYYVHEGLYLNEYNEDRMKLIFENAQMNHDSYVTIKCSNAAVFSEVQSKLIDEQEVFRFLDSQGTSIAYTTNQVQLTLSFWI